MISVAKIRLDPPKSTRLFKGIICDDISEFESHMASQLEYDRLSTMRSKGERSENSSFFPLSRKFEKTKAIS